MVPVVPHAHALFPFPVLIPLCYLTCFSCSDLLATLLPGWPATPRAFPLPIFILIPARYFSFFLVLLGELISDVIMTSFRSQCSQTLIFSLYPSPSSVGYGLGLLVTEIQCSEDGRLELWYANVFEEWVRCP